MRRIESTPGETEPGGRGCGGLPRHQLPLDIRRRLVLDGCSALGGRALAKSSPELEPDAAEPLADPSRPLSPYERHWHLLHRHGVMVISVAVCIRGRLGPDLLREALAAVQRRHPCCAPTSLATRELRFEWRGTTEIPVEVDPARTSGTGTG
jgi:hypothetical protein